MNRMNIYIYIYIYIHVFDHRPCAARRRHCFFFFKGRSAPVLVVKTVIFSSLCLFFDLVAIVRLRLDVTLSNPIQPVLARKMKQAKSEVTISLLGTYTPGTFFTSWHAKNPCFLVSWIEVIKLTVGQPKPLLSSQTGLWESERFRNAELGIKQGFVAVLQQVAWAHLFKLRKGPSRPLLQPRKPSIGKAHVSSD